MPGRKTHCHRLGDGERCCLTLRRGRRRCGRSQRTEENSELKRTFESGSRGSSVVSVPGSQRRDSQDCQKDFLGHAGLQHMTSLARARTYVYVCVSVRVCVIFYCGSVHPCVYAMIVKQSCKKNMHARTTQLCCENTYKGHSNRYVSQNTLLQC